jgi:hypothetical protein
MSLIMPTRILIVGGGGREHALAWKLAAEPGVNEVVVAPGSDGIALEPRVRRAGVDPLDPDAVVAVARREAAELVVVGPEAALAAGVADALTAAGIPVFGRRRRRGSSRARRSATRGPRRQLVLRRPAGGRGVAFARRLPPGQAWCQGDGLAPARVHGCPARRNGRSRRWRPPAPRSAGAPTARRSPGRSRRWRPGASSPLRRRSPPLPMARDHKRRSMAIGAEHRRDGRSSPLGPADRPPRLLAPHGVLAELARRGTPFRGACMRLDADRGRAVLSNATRPATRRRRPAAPRRALGPILHAAARGDLSALADSATSGACRPSGRDRRRRPRRGRLSGCATIG